MASYHHYARYEAPENSKWRTAAGVSRPVVKICRDFCLETSMHGFNHIATPRRHLFERLLWAFVTAAAIWGAVDISLGQWQRYNENPTVVTLEKDFRTWWYSLPAITACSKSRVKQSILPEVIRTTWNVTPDHEKYAYYSRFVTTVADSTVLDLAGYQEFKDDETLNVDLYKLAVEVMPDFAVKTSLSEDVDPTWVPVMTEAGACYTTNSRAIHDITILPLSPNETSKFPIKCKYSTMSCFLIMEVSSNCNFYPHSPYDIMDITHRPSEIILTLNRASSLSVIETRCGKGVNELAPTRRDCRYTSEPMGGGRKVFSTNTCRLTCRSKLAVKLCGCKPFYYSFEEAPTCTPAGMACLSAHAHVLANNAGDRCSCAQQCVDALFKEISTEDQYWEKGPFVHRGSLRYTVKAPRTRYTREIVFHFQDLVVSFGGAAGLFLGASFISFVEIFYFVLERVFRVCLPEDPKKEHATAVPQSRAPYETSRVKELTTILDTQRRYEQGAPFKLYY